MAAQREMPDMLWVGTKQNNGDDEKGGVQITSLGFGGIRRFREFRRGLGGVGEFWGFGLQDFLVAGTSAWG